MSTPYLRRQAVNRFRSFVVRGLLVAGLAVAGTAGLSKADESPGATQDASPSATTRAVVDVTGRVFPAVVRLDVAQEVYREGKRTLARGIGSGVIIAEQGRILTNYHVAGRAAEIYITLFNKERVP